MEPENERNYYKRYRAHLRKRNHGAALSDLSAALRLKPTYKTALGQRAKLELQMGRCSDAVRSPTHPSTRRLIDPSTHLPTQPQPTQPHHSSHHPVWEKGERQRLDR